MTSDSNIGNIRSQGIKSSLIRSGIANHISELLDQENSRIHNAGVGSNCSRDLRERSDIIVLSVVRIFDTSEMSVTRFVSILSSLRSRPALLKGHIHSS